MSAVTRAGWLKDVDAALHQVRAAWRVVLSAETRRKEYVAKLKAEKRYQRDVY
jgi:sulfite reductase alpha subunit-like flavoprotein